MHGQPFLRDPQEKKWLAAQDHALICFESLLAHNYWVCLGKFSLNLKCAYPADEQRLATTIVRVIWIRHHGVT